jgi:hypothetical protein
MDTTTAAAGPRIPWSRISVLHFAAASVVAFVAGFLIARNPEYPRDLPSWIVVGVLAALVGGPVTAGLTLIGARVAHGVVVRSRRGVGREAVAVVAGALAGAVVISLLLLALTGDPFTLVVVPVLGLPAGLGLAVRVLMAWRRRPAP